MINTDLSSYLFASFFEAVNLFGESKELLSGEEASDSVMEKDVKDYLQKGERLVDLARTVYQKKVGKLSLTDVEKHIFSFQVTREMSMYDVIQRIAKSFTRPCLKSMESCDDEYASMLLEAVACPGIEVTLAFEEDDFYNRYLRACMNKKDEISPDEKVICVIFKEQGYAPMRIIGVKNGTHKVKDAAYARIYGNYRFISIADLGYFFAALAIYAQVTRKVHDFLKLSEKERELCESYQLAREELERYTNRYLSKVLKFNTEKDFRLSSLEHMLSYPVNMKQNDMRDKEFLQFLYRKGACINAQSSSYWQWERQLRDKGISFGIGSLADFSACYLMRDDYCFRYHNFIRNVTSDEHFWCLPVGYRTQKSSRVVDTACMELFTALFRIIADEKYQIKQQEDYYRELEETTHAKSYQLKKTIPAKILTEMERSLFNEYFGFVEFDEQTDISKAQEIALEFTALKETYLKSIDSSENAIRFRKLGNHKAVGLYYPSVKCLCVDIHCPSSLVHEYGHLIDYSLGGLSSLSDFRKIKSMYVDYIYHKMEQNNTFKSAMKGKGKYNLKYFTLPTEIFARSFEIYVSLVLGVRNSIVPESFSEVYPTDETFLQEIARYFDTLLGLPNRAVEKVEGVAPIFAVASN